MENRESSPAETLYQICSHYLVLGESKRRWPRPGQVIERQPDRTREILRQLKSDDLRSPNHYLMGMIDPSGDPHAWTRDETFQRYGDTLREQRRANGAASRLRARFDLRRRPNWT
jgi:hypothetical protein